MCRKVFLYVICVVIQWYCIKPFQIIRHNGSFAWIVSSIYSRRFICVGEKYNSILKLDTIWTDVCVCCLYEFAAENIQRHEFCVPSLCQLIVFFHLFSMVSCETRCYFSLLLPLIIFSSIERFQKQATE